MIENILGFVMFAVTWRWKILWKFNLLVLSYRSCSELLWRHHHGPSPVVWLKDKKTSASSARVLQVYRVTIEAPAFQIREYTC